MAIRLDRGGRFLPLEKAANALGDLGKASPVARLLVALPVDRDPVIHLAREDVEVEMLDRLVVPPRSAKHPTLVIEAHTRSVERTLYASRKTTMWSRGETSRW